MQLYTSYIELGHLPKGQLLSKMADSSLHFLFAPEEPQSPQCEEAVFQGKATPSIAEKSSSGAPCSPAGFADARLVDVSSPLLVQLGDIW